MPFAVSCRRNVKYVSLATAFTVRVNTGATQCGVVKSNRANFSTIQAFP